MLLSPVQERYQYTNQFCKKQPKVDWKWLIGLVDCLIKHWGSWLSSEGLNNSWTGPTKKLPERQSQAVHGGTWHKEAILINDKNETEEFLTFYKEKGFWLYIGKNLFTYRAVRFGNRLPKDVVQYPSSDILKTWNEIALMILWSETRLCKSL